VDRRCDESGTAQLTRAVRDATRGALTQAKVRECPHRVFSRGGPQEFFSISCFIASFSSERLAMIRRIRVFSSSIAGASQLATFHAAEFRLPIYDRVWMHAVTAAEIDERRAGVVFFEDRDELRLGEARLPHTGFLSAILTGKSTISIGPDLRGRVGETIKMATPSADTKVMALGMRVPSPATKMSRTVVFKMPSDHDRGWSPCPLWRVVNGRC